MGRWIAIVAGLIAAAVAIVVLVAALLPAAPPTDIAAGTIARELAQVAAVKLRTEDFHYSVTGNCTPNPGTNPAAPGLVCYVQALNPRHPKKQPLWAEWVTCLTTGDVGTSPRCYTTGGDALQ
jgi:hypothetical protein